MKIQQKIAVLVCMAVLLLLSSNLRSESLVLDHTKAQLGPVSELFFEPFARADVSGIPFEEFTKVSGSFVRFEQNTGSYWLRFSLTNPSDADLERIITFDFPHIVAAHLYRYENGRLERAAAHAAQMPLRQREVVNRYPALLFEIPRESTAQFYLNIRLKGKANQALEYEMRLYPLAKFFSEQMGSLLVLIGFIGFMFALLVYNLVLYTRVGIRGYLFYSLYLIAQIIGLAAFEGLFYMLPRPPSVSTVVVLTTITPMLCCFFLIHFGRDILELKRTMPAANRIMSWVGYALLFMMTAAATGIRWINLPMEITGVVSIIALACVALLIYRRGNKAALYFAISFAFLVLGYSTELLLYSTPAISAGNELLSPGVVLWSERYFYYSCAAIEMVFLSLALATSIVQIRDDKEKAQRLAFESLQERQKIQHEYSAKLEKDIDERTREVVAQSELLAEQAAELRQVDEMKSRFFTNLSHEFKTPLTLIRGPVQNFLDGRYGELEPGGRESLELTARNVDRLNRLINELLVLSELESGSVTLAAAEHDIVGFCRRTGSLFTHTAKERDIVLDVQLPDRPVPVYFDEEKLEKVLCNLLSNAFKYSPSGTHVVLSMEAREDEPRSTGSFVTLKVEDEGVGIALDEQEQVFHRFYRSESTQEQSVEGTGVGLALVKELVELHGGHVGVRSREPESGSCFYVSLPLGADHLQGDELAPQYAVDERGVTQVPLAERADTVEMDSEAKVPEASGKQVEERPLLLVVEDNNDMRDYLVSLLTSKYEVHAAANGKLALQALETGNVSLVLSDVMMPELDGIGLLSAIRQHAQWQTLPVVLLTARSDDENRLQALRARADDFLAKPFNADELLLRVENLLVRQSRTLQPSRHPHFPVASLQALDSSEQEFLARAVDVVQSQLQDQAFDVAALAESLHMSLSTLRRRLDQAASQTPAQFIRQLRLQQAHLYIQSKHFRTMAETAYAVGFSQPGYFARLYKRYVASLESSG